MEQPSVFPAGGDIVIGRRELSPPIPTLGEIRRRFVERTPGPARGGGAERGDHDLNPGMMPTAELRAAAVLVPLVARLDGISILLTQRTTHLPRHPGQIAFPGGRIEDSDANVVAAALRETEEEIGLDRAHVEPVGELDRYITRTGFTVTPVVGIVSPPFTLVPNPHEVADVFEVPLAHFLDEANHKIDGRMVDGRERRFYAMPYGQRYIWGATAGMLKNLHFILTTASQAGS